MPDESISDSDDNNKNCFGCDDERALWTRIWQGVAAASLGINLAAMAIEGSAVAIVAGLIACLIAPVVIILQMKLGDLDSTCLIVACVADLEIYM
jgi:hypothetical protein